MIHSISTDMGEFYDQLTSIVVLFCKHNIVFLPTANLHNIDIRTAMHDNHRRLNYVYDDNRHASATQLGIQASTLHGVISRHWTLVLDKANGMNKLLSC